MKIFVSVKSNQKTESVENMGSGHYKVRVKAPAIEGKANKAVVKILADFLGVQKKSLCISKGLKAKTKIIIIE